MFCLQAVYTAPKLIMDRQCFFCTADMTTFSKVEHRQVIVESVIGFFTLQELMGLHTQHSSNNSGSNGMDIDADDCADDATAAARARPVSRLIQVLQQAQHQQQQYDTNMNATSFRSSNNSRTSHNSSAGTERAWKRQRSTSSSTTHGYCSDCYDREDTQYVPVAWCEQQQLKSDWTAVALAPASTTDCSSGAVLLQCEVLCVPSVTMAPDMAWVRLLNSYNNASAGLMKTNALLSTLGGGRFMCRQVAMNRLASSI